MPSFTLKNQPRFPIKVIDTSDPITTEQLGNAMANNVGITLCIRSATGHPDRGGRFFCIENTSHGEYCLETTEGVFIDKFDSLTLVEFINHCTGLNFDQRMLLYCQNIVNFKSDE